MPPLIFTCVIFWCICFPVKSPWKVPVGDFLSLNWIRKLVRLQPVTAAVCELEVVYVSRVASLCDWNDVIDRWTHWIRTRQRHVDLFAADPAGVLRAEEVLFVPLILLPERS